MNITIIGAGPIGCYAGYFLAKAGHTVTIYENHAQVGCPIQCTGILTSDFDQFQLPMESYLVNTIDTIEVYSPQENVAITQKDYIVCRTKFDNFFATMARDAGATILVNHSFTRKEGNELIIKDTINNTEIKITPDIVIAADGPLSPTAKAYGFFHPKRENYFGIQAVVEGKFEPHTIKTYFGNIVCPGLFAWVVPESATRARVGLATLRNTKKYFDTFMKEHNFTSLEIQAGAIPVYNSKQQLHKDNCYVIGDASGYVKATTLGGLVPALRQAKLVAECILKDKKIEAEIAPVRKQMRLHLKVHDIFNRFTDADWDRLVRYVKQPKIQHVFEQYTRDNPLPLLIKTLLKEPRFLYFSKYLFS